ncbi:MAG: hypothetical protein ABI369_03935 [Acetobacteraceae bacterium]
MTGVTALGWQNYVKTAILAANSVAPNMGISNIANDQGAAASGWQTAAGVVTGAGPLFTAKPQAMGLPWGAVGVFRTNLTNNAVVTFQLILAGSIISSVLVTAVAGQAVWIPPVAILADSAQIVISDPGNPDGFINVPLCYAGPLWFPLTGASFSSTQGRDDQVVEATTRGGQEWPTLYWQRRRFNLELGGVRASEVWPQIDALEIVARIGTNVLLIPNIADPMLQNAALFGRLTPTADISYPYMGADRRAWKANVTERL